MSEKMGGEALSAMAMQTIGYITIVQLEGNALPVRVVVLHGTHRSRNTILYPKVGA
jgi:hypothetical protein